MTSNWAQRPLDVEYLLDSGLLFEANRAVFHRFGMALVVERPPGAPARLVLVDRRESPGTLAFDAATWARGLAKFAEFMATYGDAQRKRRTMALGWDCQQGVPHEPPVYLPPLDCEVDCD